jgi:hypothetical protein
MHAPGLGANETKTARHRGRLRGARDVGRNHHVPLCARGVVAASQSSWDRVRPVCDVRLRSQN